MENQSVLGNGVRRVLSGTYLTTLAVSVVLASAAIAKVFSYRQFEDTLAVSRLIPSMIIPLMAKFVISLEFVIAIGLLIPSLRAGSIKCSAVMFSIFMSYAVWRWVNGIPVPCRCFGYFLRMSPVQAIAVNLCLLSLLVPLMRRPHSSSLHRINTRSSAVLSPP